VVYTSNMSREYGKAHYVDHPKNQIVIVIILTQAIARSQVVVVSCDSPQLRHLNSGGHCFRGNQTPSALKRGFRGKSSPLSAAVPIGTAEQFIISHGVQRKRQEREDARSHVHVFGPNICSQFARMLPSHHMLPSSPIRPYSSSHLCRVRRFALK
jgi:hypothetical protein